MSKHADHHVERRDRTLAEADLLRIAVGEFVRHARAHDELPPGQAAALGHLVRDGACSIRDLADRERVRHQSMARTIKLLAEDDLVIVIGDEIDRRRVLVKITEAGRNRLDIERYRRSAWIADAVETRLTPKERETARQIPAILNALTTDR